MMLKKFTATLAATAIITSALPAAEAISGSNIMTVTASAASTTLSAGELDAIKGRYESHGYYLKKYYCYNNKTVVTDLQRMLNAEGGYSAISEDGIFGPATEQSVRSFQRRYSLTVDGIAGKNTYAKLFEVLYARADAAASIAPPANTVTNADGTINVDAMLEYARRHWSTYNTSYRSYKSSQTDCCNFISQLIVAGGAKETSEWHGSYNYSDVTSSFKYIPDLISYLRSEYGIGYYTKNQNLISTYPSSYDGTSFNINDVEVGDCVTIVVKSSRNNYGRDSYGRDHIMMVTGVNYSTGYIYFTGHTNDRYYGISSGGYIHISGVAGLLKTSDIRLKGQNSPSVSVIPETGEEPSPVIVIKTVNYGDVNNDNNINLTDVIQLMLYTNGMVDDNDINIDAADVNCDGTVNSEDYTILLKYNAGMIDYLPYKN